MVRLLISLVALLALSTCDYGPKSRLTATPGPGTATKEIKDAFAAVGTRPRSG